jgi:hypothetical protein
MIIDLIVVLKKGEDPDPKEIISDHIREAQNATAINEDMFFFYPKLSWCSLKAEVRRLVVGTVPSSFTGVRVWEFKIFYNCP